MKKINCPVCNGKNIALILWGLPAETEEIAKAVHEKKIVFGGCCVSENDPKWECNDCYHRWRNDSNNTDSFDYDQGFNLDEVYD